MWQDLNGGVDNADIRSENLPSMGGHASSSEQKTDAMIPKFYPMKSDFGNSRMHIILQFFGQVCCDVGAQVGGGFIRIFW